MKFARLALWLHGQGVAPVYIDVPIGELQAVGQTIDGRLFMVAEHTLVGREPVPTGFIEMSQSGQRFREVPGRFDAAPLKLRRIMVVGIHDGTAAPRCERWQCVHCRATFTEGATVREDTIIAGRMCPHDGERLESIIEPS